MRWSKRIFQAIGVFPIRDHYYEPLFNFNLLHKSLRSDRDLPGIDFNDEAQLELLKSFHYQEELRLIPIDGEDLTQFYYRNNSFGVIDAQYLYCMIRQFKPQKIVEIGSGNSTLMAVNALNKNRDEDPDYACKHVCVEPYEMPYLEKIDVEVIRERVELVDKRIFQELEEKDILFIDSSHIIRPQGDVLLEYLEVLPILKPGVVIHVHDIFTPKDYLNEWVLGDIKLWNEQYLLEAFLSLNGDYKIIGALNYLRHHHYQELSKNLPTLSVVSEDEPCSFWLIRC